MQDSVILESAERVVASNEIAMIGTISSNNFPNIRALRIMKREGLKTFYFSTRASSEKVKQMKRRKKGCIYFYDQTTFTFANVLIEGKFQIIKNTSFEISNFYKMDADPYEFCTIKFIANKLYYYVPYTKHKIDMRKKK